MKIDLDNMEKPQCLRERRCYYRFFYNSNPNVGEAIDKASCMKFGLKRMGDTLQEDYIYDFFNNMCIRLHLWEMVISIAHEWLLMGNCFLFAEEHDWRKNKTVKEKPVLFDKNALYEGWSKVLVLPPDQVRVRKSPLSSTVELEYVPDPEVLRLLKKKSRNMPRHFIEKAMEAKSIPLDSDPFSGSFAAMFARRVSGYDVLGTSMVEHYMDKLCNQESITVIIPDAAMDLLKHELKVFVEKSLFLPVAVKKGFFDKMRRSMYPEISIL
jgi:hypothetical protein